MSYKISIHLSSFTVKIDICSSILYKEIYEYVKISDIYLNIILMTRTSDFFFSSSLLSTKRDILTSFYFVI